MPGLWDGMRISTLNKMISMRCDEEVLSYLTHIEDVWSQLLNHNEKMMQMVDSATVRALELKAPKHSKFDAQKLYGQLISGQIFAACSPQDRDIIWNVLRNVPRLIPSLFAFFADLNYLQACAGSMRHLVEPTARNTMHMALDNQFIGRSDDWDLGYRHLWLYAMQNHPSLPAPSKKNMGRQKRLAKARIAKPDEVVLSDFAALADQSGFQSEQISALKQRSSDREIARTALSNARKPDRYQDTDHTLESHIDQRPGRRAFCNCDTPFDVASQMTRLTRGMPNLSIYNLHVEIDGQGETITSLFVRRSVYFAFFGRPNDIHAPFHPLSPRDYSVREAEPSSLTQQSPSNLALDTSGVLQDNVELERIEQEVSSVRDSYNVRDGDHSQQTQRDDRRATQLDLEKVIADGLASVPENTKDQPKSSWSTNNADANSDRPQYEQTLERPLHIMAPVPSKVRIKVYSFARGAWNITQSLLVNLLDSSEVERVMKKYIRKRMRPFNIDQRPLIPETCFQTINANGSNAIYLMPEDEIKVDNRFLEFVPDTLTDREAPGATRQKNNHH